MDEKQIEKIAQELSEKDLNDLAAGKPLSSKAKKVLKYVGIGVVSAAAAASAGVGIAALVGWKTGKGPFNYLNNSKSNNGGLSENFGNMSSGNGKGHLAEAEALISDDDDALSYAEYMFQREQDEGKSDI